MENEQNYFERCKKRIENAKNIGIYTNPYNAIEVHIDKSLIIIFNKAKEVRSVRFYSSEHGVLVPLSEDTTELLVELSKVRSQQIKEEANAKLLAKL